MKRKCSAKQLRALAKGRRIRKANLRKKKGFGRRKTLKRRRSTTRLKSPRKKKRRYRRADSMSSLTGGTRDVNPQFLNVAIKQTTENEVKYFTFALPIARTPGIGNKVTVMEVLKIGLRFYDPPFRHIGTTAGYTATYGAIMIGEQSIHHRFNHWSVLAEKAVYIHNHIPATEAYFHITEMPWWFDLTDGAGHGVLVATDTMTVNISTVGMAAGTFQGTEAKILYRFKRVGMTEYVGIVQSQQGK